MLQFAGSPERPAFTAELARLISQDCRPGCWPERSAHDGPTGHELRLQCEGLLVENYVLNYLKLWDNVANPKSA